MAKIGQKWKKIENVIPTKLFKSQKNGKSEISGLYLEKWQNKMGFTFQELQGFKVKRGRFFRNP